MQFPPSCISILPPSSGGGSINSARARSVSPRGAIRSATPQPPLTRAASQTHLLGGRSSACPVRRHASPPRRLSPSPPCNGSSRSWTAPRTRSNTPRRHQAHTNILSQGRAMIGATAAQTLSRNGSALTLGTRACTPSRSFPETSSGTPASLHVTPPQLVVMNRDAYIQQQPLPSCAGRTAQKVVSSETASSSTQSPRGSPTKNEDVISAVVATEADCSEPEPETLTSSMKAGLSKPMIVIEVRGTAEEGNEDESDGNGTPRFISLAKDHVSGTVRMLPGELGEQVECTNGNTLDAQKNEEFVTPSLTKIISDGCMDTSNTSSPDGKSMFN